MFKRSKIDDELLKYIKDCGYEYFYFYKDYGLPCIRAENYNPFKGYMKIVDEIRWVEVTVLLDNNGIGYRRRVKSLLCKRKIK